MKMKFISQGAEAKIFLNEKENLIIKDRTPKLYRIPELDKKIIKQRTKAERKLLEKASKIISAPNPLPSKEINIIKMPFVNGKKLSNFLNNFPLKKQKEIMEKAGKSIAELHKNDIIHGDLTTSNMILKEENIFFIDFGLGYISKKIEDKAVDLHLLKQALEAKHFVHWKELFQKFQEIYSKNYSEFHKVFERMNAIEKRGRYRH